MLVDFSIFLGPAAPTGRQPPAMPANFDSLSEEEQIALALQISLEQEQGAAAAGGGGEERSVAVEPMDTGEPSKSVDMAETDEVRVFIVGQVWCVLEYFMGNFSKRLIIFQWGSRNFPVCK